MAAAGWVWDLDSCTARSRPGRQLIARRVLSRIRLHIVSLCGIDFGKLDGRDVIDDW